MAKATQLRSFMAKATQFRSFMAKATQFRSFTSEATQYKTGAFDVIGQTFRFDTYIKKQGTLIDLNTGDTSPRPHPKSRALLERSHRWAPSKSWRVASEYDDLRGKSA